MLDIHRGDKMNYLVSMDSDPVSIPAWIKKNRTDSDPEKYKVTAADADNFQNGQHTLTLIRTEKGRTIEIHHDVATHAPTTASTTLAGTEGYASKYPCHYWHYSEA